MKSIKKLISVVLATLIISSSVVSVDAAAIDFSVASSPKKTASVSTVNNKVVSQNNTDNFERVNSAFKNISFENLFDGIDFSMDFASSFKDLAGFTNNMKVAVNNARLFGNNFFTIAANTLNEITSSSTSKVEYGVSSTYTVTIPTYILATKPGKDLNRYSVSAEDVLIPVHTELGVSVEHDGQLIHHDDDSIALDYNLYQEVSDADDIVIAKSNDRIFKVPAGVIAGNSSNIYATLASDVKYAGVYEEATVVFKLKVTDASYSAEDIEKQELMFKVGKTKPENVLAQFNEDFTEVTIFSNGEESDGLMKDWSAADASNPFYAHKDTLQSVSFTGSYALLKSIGMNAFKGCTNITGTITIPASVESVGTSAFEDCTGITSIIFKGEELNEGGLKKVSRRVALTPDKPTTYKEANTVIGTSAFKGCSGMTTLEIGNTIKSISASAFENCTSLSSINTGASCETLGEKAFAGCTSVSGDVIMPAVKTSAFSAFKDVPTGLTVIMQAPEIGKMYALPSEANLVLGKTVNVLTEEAFYATVDDDYYYAYLCPPKSITFENDEGLVTIGDSAFKELTTTTFANLNFDRTETIGEEAFYGCQALNIDTFNVTSILQSVGDSAFSGYNKKTPSIKKVVFSDDSNTVVNGNAFASEAITSVDFGKSTAYIGDYAFAKSTPWTTDIVIPNTLQCVGSNVFVKQNVYSSVNVWFKIVDNSGNIPEFDYSIITLTGDYTVKFDYLYSHSGSLVEGYENGENSRVIYNVENVNCTNIWGWLPKNIEFTDTVKKITADFSADATDNSKYALNTIQFGNSVEYIGDDCFNRAEFQVRVSGTKVNELTNCDIVIPDSCKYIGSNAFACGPYTKYRSLTLGNGIEYIGNGAFSNMSSASGDIDIPDTCTYIGDNAFINGSNFDKISLGKNIKVIGENAFKNCSKATGTIKLPSTLDTSYVKPEMPKIGDKAEGSDIAVGMEIKYYPYYSNPAPVITENHTYTFIPTTTGKYYFELSFASGAKEVVSVYSSDNTLLKTYCTSSSLGGGIETIDCVKGESYRVEVSYTSGKDFSWADSYNYSFVVNALKGASSYLGTSAFEGCKNLTGTIIIPNIKMSYTDSNENNGIGTKLFKDCTGVTGVTFENGFEKIPDEMFSGCAKLENVTYSTNTNSVGYKAFYNCPLIKDTPISNSLVYIGNSAFEGCSSIDDEIVFPENLSEVGDRAFYGCGNIQSLTIANSNCDLGKNVFTNCTGIRNLTVGYENVDTVIVETLGCKTYANSWTLTLLNTNKTIDNNAFNSVPNLSVINFGNSLVSIGDYAFYNDKALSGILVLPDTCENIGEWAFASEDGTMGSAHYMNTPRSASFTGIVMSKNIKTIGDYAFYGCYQMTGDIHFPATLKSIGTLAFSGAYGRYGIFTEKVNGSYITQSTALTGVYFEDCDATISDSAFNNCFNIETLDLGNGTTVWGTDCFKDCSGLVTLNIGNGLTEIADNMFSGCSSLANLDLGGTVKTIGNSAFEGTVVAGTLVIPESCTSIGNRAFPNLTEVTSLTIGSNVKTIGNEAFIGLSKLSGTLTLPVGLESVGDRAFANSTKFTALNAPATAYTTGEYVFSGCTGLQSVTIPSDATFIAKGLFSGCTSINGTVAIHNGITEIKDEAFKNCENIDEVTLGNNIEKIGASAFSGNKGINVALTIPNKCLTIGNAAFRDCVKLPGVNFGTGVTTIDDYAFYHCIALKTLSIPNSVTTIGSYAFGTDSKSSDTIGYIEYNGTTWVDDADAMRINSVIMSENIETIGDYAFKGCAYLETITILNTLTSVGDGVFAYSGLKSYNLPNIVFEESDSGFLECKNLKAITIPEGTTKLATSLYRGCANIAIAPVIPGSVETIGDSCFGGCYAMKGVTFNEGLKVIEDNAFTNCQSIHTLVFPNSLEKIGNSAFGGYAHGSLWNGFEEYENMYISSVTFGTGLKTIGDRAFFPSTNWSCELVFPATLESIGTRAFTRWNNAAGAMHSDFEYFEYVVDEDGEFVLDKDGEKIKVKNNITGITFQGNNLKTIGEAAFQNCGFNTKPLTLPNSVTAIGDSAFEGCASVPLITVSSALETIPAKAFYRCYAATNITIPEGVKTISESAFEDCTSLDGRLTIPSTTETIGKRSFYNCTSLDELVIGENVKTIGDMAFYGFNGNVISMPESIENLGVNIFGDVMMDEDGAIYMGAYLLSFDNIKNLETYTVRPNTVSINENAFKDENLKAVVLPETVRVIGKDTFRNMTNLTSVNLPDSIKSIKSGAFYGDSKLETAVKCANLTEIGDNAFYNNAKLTEIALTSKIKSIGDSAFSGCTNAIGEINVPDTCTVGNYAFANCKNITKVVINGDKPVVGNYAFQNCTGIKTIEQTGKLIDTLCDHKDADKDGVCDICSKVIGEIATGKTLTATLNYGETKYIKFIPEISGSYVYKVTGKALKEDYDSAVNNITFRVLDADKNVLYTAYADYTYSSEYKPGTTTPYYISQFINGWTATAGETYYFELADKQGVEGDTEDYNINVSLSSSRLTDKISTTAFSGVTGVTSLSVNAVDVENNLLSKFNYKNYTTPWSLAMGNTVEDFAAISSNKIESVKIGNNCKVVPENAFFNATSLKSVDFGTGVTEIGKSAFNGCTGLTAINFPTTLKTIGESAFYGCKNITEFSIPDGVESLGQTCFSGCTGITEIVIPESVKSIGVRCFDSCSNLVSVTSKGGNKTFNTNAFYGCTKLANVYIESYADWCGNTFADYTSSSPFYYATKLYLNGELVTAVVIPSDVKVIKSNTISQKLVINSITVPDTVTEIYEGAFYGINSITSLALPDLSKIKNVTYGTDSITSFAKLFGKTSSYGSSTYPVLQFATSSSTIYYNVPKDLANLTITSGSIDAKVLSLGSVRYFNGIKTLTIGENVSSIAANSIVNYKDTVIIEGTKTKVAGGALKGCFVKNLTFAFGDTGITCLAYLFSGINDRGSGSYYCGTNTNESYGYCLPYTVSTINVLGDSIPDGAFSGYSNINTITLANTVKSLGDYAFSGCSGLTAFTIPEGLTEVGNYTFNGCTHIADLTIPQSVTSIGNYAFASCAGVKELVSDKLVSIGEYAFNGCENLARVSLTDKTTTIGERAFSSCYGLRTVELPNTLTSLGEAAFSSCTALESVNLGSGLKTIPNYAFDYCSNLETISSLNTVETIGDSAFKNCSALDVDLSLTNVKSIGCDAFNECSEINSLVIGNDCTILGRAFFDCTGLKSVTFGSNVKMGVSEEDYIRNVFSGSTGVETFTTNSNFTCESGYYGFESSVKTLNLGKDVTSIGSIPVYKGYWGSLEKIKVDSDNAVFISKTGILYNKAQTVFAWIPAKLQEYVIIPEGITRIGYSLFSNTKITGVELPTTLTYIDDEAFKNCVNLAGNLVIPANCTNIGINAFSSCTTLRTLNLLGSTAINNYAFYDCSALKTANLTNATAIGESAFNGCSSLSGTIDLTNTHSLGKNAFVDAGNTAKVETIIIGSGIAEIPDGCFFGMTSNVSNLVCNSNAYVINNGVLYTKDMKNVVLGTKTVGTTYTVPSTVENIAAYAFAFVPVVENIVLPSATTFIYDYAFHSMPDLVGFTFPDGLLWIGNYAFTNCENLAIDTQLPESLMYIGEHAFEGCSSIVWVGIPKTTQYCGRNAFTGVPNATLDPENPYVSVHDGEIYGGNPNVNLKYIGRNAITDVEYHLSADKKTLTISGNGAMKDWRIPAMFGGENSGIEETPFKNMLATIETIIIEDGVTNIGEGAFSNEEAFESIMEGSNLSMLKKVVIGKDVANIGLYSFFGATNLETIEVSSENTNFTVSNNSLYTADMKTLLLTTVPESKTYTGPNTLETINSTAFSGKAFTSITLPETVHSIPAAAFALCTSLEELNLPGANTFETFAFSFLPSLKTLSLPVNIAPMEEFESDTSPFSQITATDITLKIVGNGNAPYYDSNNMITGDTSLKPAFLVITSAVPVKEIVIGDGVTGLSNLMFANMGMEEDPLVKVVLGKNVSSIGEGVFMARNNLAEFVIPAENTNFVVANGIVYNTAKTTPVAVLTSVSEHLTLPETVTEIPFGFCTMNNKVTNITLGTGITKVGAGAFTSMENLERVEIRNSNVEFGIASFGNDKMDVYGIVGSTTETYVNELNDNEMSEATFFTLCLHEHTRTDAGLTATCTTIGYTEGTFCEDCNSWIEGHEEIVLHHIDKDGDTLCDVCGESVNDINLNTPLDVHDTAADADGFEDYTWLKFTPRVTALYRCTVRDTAADDHETTCVVIHADSIDGLKLEDVANLVVNSDSGYPADVGIELTAGETYYIAVGFDSTTREGDLKVTLTYPGCTHEHTKVISEGTAPTSCSQPGNYGVEMCTDCNVYIHNGEAWKMAHTDADKNGTCDVCGETLSDINLNDPVVVTDTKNPEDEMDIVGQLQWLKVVPLISGVYNITAEAEGKDIMGVVLKIDDISTFDINNYQTPEQQRDVLPAQGSGTGVMSIPVSLTANVVYYIGVGLGSNDEGDISVTLKFPGCPHEHTEIRSAGTPPTSCTDPGVYGVVWCNDCNDFAHNGEAWNMPHTDANDDGYCDTCNSELSDILPGETEEITVVANQVTYLKFVPTTSGSYTFAASGTGDTYGVLCDETKTEITNNDDYDSSHFSITYNLEAGKTYYWGARYFDKSESGNFLVTLTAN